MIAAVHLIAGVFAGLLAQDHAAGAGTAAAFPLLPAIILVPLAGVAIILLTPPDRADTIRLTSILTTLTAGALTVYMLIRFDTSDNYYQFVSQAPWIKAFDIKFIVGIDGISLFLVVMTGILFPISVVAAKPAHDAKGYYAWLTLLEVGCLGVFMALDLFLFFVFFEITLVPLYMLIGKWGHGRRVYAANKFFLFTMAGSALMLVSIVSLAVFSRAGDASTVGHVSFDLERVIAAAPNVTQLTARLIFGGMMVAFMVKTPVFPLHTWLPDAHTEAPTAGSVDLAGILLKLGTYGFLRFGLYLFPEASVTFAPVLLTLGVMGIVYGAVVATMQKNLKRLVAYSSVSHMGFCIVGLFALTRQGLEGSVLQMVNHGITTGALFVLLGFIYTRRHTYEMSELKGLQKAAPVLAGIFTLVMLASVGLPGLNGFVGEFLVLVGTYLSYPGFALVAATGVIVAALYLLWAYQRAFHGEPDEANRSIGDLRLNEKLVMVPLVALIIVLGVYPKPVLDRIGPSVQRVLDHMAQVNPDFKEHGSQNGSDLKPAAAGASPGGESPTGGTPSPQGGQQGQGAPVPEPATSAGSPAVAGGQAAEAGR